MFKPLSIGRWGGGRSLLLGIAGVATILAIAAPANAAQFAYVTNDGSGDVFQYKIGSSGLLAPLSPPTVVAADSPQGLAVSPDGRSVYVTATNFAANFAGELFQYDVGGAGALTPKSPARVNTGDNPRGVAVSPDGENVYVANVGSPSTGDTISQYDVGPGGMLAPKSPATVAAGDQPSDVAVSPDGRSVYVANSFDHTVSQYDVGAGGALTPKDPPTVDAGGTPFGVAVSPDGQNVYLANLFILRSGNVAQFDVGPGGVLSPKSPTTLDTAAAASDVVVSPDGKSVYVPTPAADRVYQYDVGSGGELSPMSQPTVAAGDGPGSVAVNTDGMSVYVANGLSNDVSQYDVAPGGGLSPKSPATVAAGDGPTGVAVTPAPLVPTTLGQCRNDGWKQFGFKGQGRCVAFVVLTRICDALERHGLHLKFCPPTPPALLRRN